ncbi:MAG: hypothetical protein J3Q66DRAFT_421676 [Benniella sp.]|nr:MAG: hypothetical protein J3Q66DRAFT_421676 [Benniella sp.]
MGNILKGKQVEASSILRKRARLGAEDEMDDPPLTTSSQDGDVVGEQDNQDSVKIAQEQAHLPLNVVFDEQFSQYFTNAVSQKYDPDNVSDFLYASCHAVDLDCRDIASDFAALQTGLPALFANGFINENHFTPSAWRRALPRNKLFAKGISVDGYYVGQDGFIDNIFENVGYHQCTNHPKYDEDKRKSERNAANALLERYFYSRGPFQIAREYQVIIVLVFGILSANEYDACKVFCGHYHFSKTSYNQAKCAWYAHLRGEPGNQRIQIVKEGALNDLQNAELSENERTLAQTNMGNILKGKQVEASSILRKRARLGAEDEMDDPPLTTSSQDGDVVGEQDNQDSVKIAQEQAHLPLNVVFDEQFSQYFTNAVSQKYDPDNVSDFLYASCHAVDLDCRDVMKKKTESTLKEMYICLRIEAPAQGLEEVRKKCRRCLNATGSFEIAKEYKVIIVLVFGPEITIYATGIRSTNEYDVHKAFCSRYHFSKTTYLVNLLVHLKICLTIKRIHRVITDVGSSPLSTEDARDTHHATRTVVEDSEHWITTIFILAGQLRLQTFGLWILNVWIEGERSDRLEPLEMF